MNTIKARLYELEDNFRKIIEDNKLDLNLFDFQNESLQQPTEYRRLKVEYLLKNEKDDDFNKNYFFELEFHMQNYYNFNYFPELLNYNFGRFEEKNIIGVKSLFNDWVVIVKKMIEESKK